MKTTGNNFKRFCGIARPLELRFWEKVDIDLNGCWTWTGQKAKNKGKFDYGYLAIRGMPTLAHRISWSIHFGEPASGLCVLHKCDNPSCVRPDHLFLGSMKDNMRDRDIKGRGSRGEKHHWTKLDRVKVMKIREMYSSGKGSTTIGKEMGLDAATVCHVVKRRTWKWL